MNDLDFDSNARKLLMHHILAGSKNGVDYAPDFRNGAPGPQSIQIVKILRHHAQLWALEMRTRVNVSAEIGRTEWLVHMRQADAEIKRFLAGHRLTTGAAA